MIPFNFPSTPSSNLHPPFDPPQPASLDQLTIDQLGNYILLTVQALQRLHASFDRKFTR